MPNATTTQKFEGPIVLVLGLTGAGKTTFINHISKSALAVGRGMKSCTATSEYVTVKKNGVEVAFVDTPGFDDPEKSDAQILIDVTTWIQTNLGGTEKITAALYLHSIETTKMRGSALDNVEFFQRLVGNKAMSNITLVTTHWDKTDEAIGKEREGYLASDPWNVMIQHGAGIYRLDNKYSSCYNMVERVLRAQPKFLQIQTEMAGERKRLSETDAGANLWGKLETKISVTENSIQEHNAALSAGNFPTPEVREVVQKSVM